MAPMNLINYRNVSLHLPPGDELHSRLSAPRLECDNGWWKALEPCGVLEDGTVVLGHGDGATPEEARMWAAQAGHRALLCDMRAE